MIIYVENLMDVQKCEYMNIKRLHYVMQIYKNNLIFSGVTNHLKGTLKLHFNNIECLINFKENVQDLYTEK